MTRGVGALNAMPESELRAALARCCNSAAWVEGMMAARPFARRSHLVKTADAVWWGLSRDEWLAAFAAHPRIGEGNGGAWSAQEQSGIVGASTATHVALAEANREYEARFGYRFIVCASGKNGPEILERLQRRLGHDPQLEISVAADEHRQIVRVRLDKLLDGLRAEGVYP